MKRYRIFFMLGLSFGLFASCNEDSPLETEQYMKQVYIVGANEVVRKVDVPFGDEPQSTFISVATGGSLNIDQDVNVTLTHGDAAIAWYNNKYMPDAPLKYRKLDDEFCEIPSMSTTIKTGEVYSRLPFFIKTSALDCDSLYALTFKIESVSAYSKHSKDTVLIMNLNFTNDYSGTYQMTATRYTLSGDEETMPTSINMIRSMKAVNKDKARFYNITQTVELTPTSTTSYDEYFKVIADHCVVFERQPDGKFIVNGWKNLSITNGTVTFSDDTFTFTYDYVYGGKNYRLKGTMKR